MSTAGGRSRSLGLSRWDAVVFDLGGVLLNLDYSATTKAFDRLAGRELAGFYSKARQADLFDRFERGEIDAVRFRAELRTNLGAGREAGRAAERAAGCEAGCEAECEAKCADAELDAAWNALLGEVPRQNLELLLRLKKTHRVYLLSNTNELHLADFLARFEREHGPHFGPWSALFHKDYYSHLLGMRKPESSIFEHVVRSEGLEPRRTLFIDDNWHNVQGARSVGLDAAWIDVPAQGDVPATTLRSEGLARSDLSTALAGAGADARQGLLGVPLVDHGLDPLRDGARDIHELFARLSDS